MEKEMNDRPKAVDPNIKEIRDEFSVNKFQPINEAGELLLEHADNIADLFTAVKLITAQLQHIHDERKKFMEEYSLFKEEMFAEAKSQRRAIENQAFKCQTIRSKK